jgi:hypothetical protein
MGEIVAFSSRLMLASSVIGVLAASSTAALTMVPGNAHAAVKVPDFDIRAEAPTPAGTAAPAVVPPVTGAQIAGLALAPARDRVNAIVAERAQAAAAAAAAAEASKAAAARAEAERSAAAGSTADRGEEAFHRWAAQFRQACDDGRVHGEVCNR